MVIVHAVDLEEHVAMPGIVCVCCLYKVVTKRYTPLACLCCDW